MKKLVVTSTIALVLAVGSSGAASAVAPHHSVTATRVTQSYTPAQQNAIRSAQSYLRFGSGFSRAGLIGQLTSKYGDRYKLADATFAVNHIKVNWNAQAVLAAKSYLKFMGFSRDGLIAQLTSKYGSQFTLAQATYAVNQLHL